MEWERTKVSKLFCNISLTKYDKNLSWWLTKVNLLNIYLVDFSEISLQLNSDQEKNRSKFWSITWQLIFGTELFWCFGKQDIAACTYKKPGVLSRGRKIEPIRKKVVIVLAIDFREFEISRYKVLDHRKTSTKNWG